MSTILAFRHIDFVLLCLSWTMTARHGSSSGLSDFKMKSNNIQLTFYFKILFLNMGYTTRSRLTRGNILWEQGRNIFWKGSILPITRIIWAEWTKRELVYTATSDVNMSWIILACGLVCCYYIIVTWFLVWFTLYIFLHYKMGFDFSSKFLLTDDK